MSQPEMDYFRVLTRGAHVPKQKKEEAETKKDDSVDRELDFFHNKKIVSKVEEQRERAASDSDNAPLSVASQEDALKLRKSYSGKVDGHDVPLPCGSFEDLVTRFKLDKRLLNKLIENHFTEPTPIQCEAIPASLNDRDVLACAPTGSGKTLAFLIPLLQQLIEDGANKSARSGPRALIVSPTKELANQIFAQVNRLVPTLQAALLSKSLSGKLKNKVIRQDKFELIITTPLRLIELVKSESLSLASVKHLIFDEADKLFDKTFVEQTDDILSHCSHPQLRKSMFSATIPSSVEEIAESIMNDHVRIIIGHKEAANAQIEQKLVFCGSEEGKLVAMRQLIQEGGLRPPVIIFLQSVTRAKALYHELLYDKINVDVIHAERTQQQRDATIDRFKKGEVWVLICTDVLARGVDFKGVNLVINYDVPISAQAYVHRIGRTGRGGRSGTAITFYTKEDASAIKPVINVMKQSGIQVAPWMDSKLTQKDKNSNRHAKNRKDISTVPSVDKKKKRQHKEMVEASKKRKIEAADE